MTCLHPPTTSPVSSKLAIVLETALAAFHLVVPQIPYLSESCKYGVCPQLAYTEKDTIPLRPCTQAFLSDCLLNNYQQ